MKKIKALLIAVGIIAILFNAAYVSAEGPGAGSGKGPRYDRGAKMDEIMEELGLTDEQKQQLKEMREKHKEGSEEIRKAMRAKRAEMRGELDKPQSDPVKLEGIIGEMAELNKVQMRHRVKGILEMKKVFTPEQYQALNEKRREMKETKGKFKRRYKHREEESEQEQE